MGFLHFGEFGNTQNQRGVGPAEAAGGQVFKYGADVAVFHIGFVRTFFHVEFLGNQAVVFHGGANNHLYPSVGGVVHFLGVAVAVQAFPQQDLVRRPAVGVVPLAFGAVAVSGQRGGGGDAAGAHQLGQLFAHQFFRLLRLAQACPQGVEVGGGSKCLHSAAAHVVIVETAGFFVPQVLLHQIVTRLRFFIPLAAAVFAAVVAEALREVVVD